MNTIVNEFTLTNELCINYTRLHEFKIIRIILNIVSIISIINVIILSILNLGFDVNNSKGIIFALITLLLSLITNFIYLTWCGVVKFQKMKLINPNLKNKLTFTKDNFTVEVNKKNIKNNYSEIKRIYSYDNFFVLEMNNKERYILPDNGFNCKIEDFISFIGEELEKCEKE